MGTKRASRYERLARTFLLGIQILGDEVTNDVRHFASVVNGGDFELSVHVRGHHHDEPFGEFLIFAGIVCHGMDILPREKGFVNLNFWRVPWAR